MWACIACMDASCQPVHGSEMYNIIFSRVHDSISKTDTAVVYPIIVSSIAAVIQSKKAVPGLPHISVLKNAIVRRMVKFHMWCNFDFLVAVVLAKFPFAVVLVGANPFLLWLSTAAAGHCPCSIPPRPPDCHTVHHWAGVLGGLSRRIIAVFLEYHLSCTFYQKP